jgi:16S rRNA processing protein RimM
MIEKNEILQIGRTQKPHGIKGELTVVFQKAEYADIDTEFYFLEIEGIPVPFFVEEFIFGTDVMARIKFEDVNDEIMASRYKNLNIFLPREFIKTTHTRDASSWDFFVGYTIIDQHGSNLGIITEIDEATINVLFKVEDGENELLIPATEDFITKIDEKNNQLGMNLPEGLISTNT